MVGVGLDEDPGRYGSSAEALSLDAGAWHSSDLSVIGEVSPEQLRSALDAVLADLNPAKFRQGDVLCKPSFALSILPTNGLAIGS